MIAKTKTWLAVVPPALAGLGLVFLLAVLASAPPAAARSGVVPPGSALLAATGPYTTYLPLVRHYIPPGKRTGWAIGDSPAGYPVILNTTDGGQAWASQGELSAWAGMGGMDISAVDDQTAWAALDGTPLGAILHTIDGGTTWFSQTIPAGIIDGIKGVKGLSRSEAWAASLHGTILHTTDGGATWTIVPHPTAPITQVNRIDALGDRDIWVADADNSGSVVHSSDNGLTWRQEHLPDVSPGVTEAPLIVHTFNATVTWSSGVRGLMFYRTLDGGAHWQRAAIAGGLDHFDDICAASADDLWAVQNGDGVSGDIWKLHLAPDGTPQITRIGPPELSGYTPEGVTCLNTTTAWVVARKGLPIDPNKPRGVIFYTPDGRGWEAQPVPVPVALWKVSFVGARR